MGAGVALGPAVGVGTGGLMVIWTGFGRVASSTAAPTMTASATTINAIMVLRGEGSGSGLSAIETSGRYCCLSITLVRRSIASVSFSSGVGPGGGGGGGGGIKRLTARTIRKTTKAIIRKVMMLFRNTPMPMATSGVSPTAGFS